MSDDLKNILSNLNSDIEQEKLLEYLNRQLTQQEQHALESHLNDDEFMSDAMDGLTQITNKEDVPLIVKQLNLDLKKKLDKHKKKKRNRLFKQDSTSYIAIIVVLLLAVIAFILIKLFISGSN